MSGREREPRESRKCGQTEADRQKHGADGRNGISGVSEKTAKQRGCFLFLDGPSNSNEKKKRIVMNNTKNALSQLKN